MCARTRVLLVNDDDDALFLIGRSVRRALPDVDVAQLRDAPAALAYCEKHHIDALVTDNSMPQMDGLTLVRAVRERNRSIPILMVTNSTHLAKEAAEAGVTSYLPAARWTEIGDALALLLQE
jgi:two-component system, chemotaxis family, chemotaxis protein CheY